MEKKEVVLTGYGVLCPLGIDQNEIFEALCAGKSGIGYLESIPTTLADRPIGGEVPDFHAKDYVKPRKNIKVMSRDIQMAFVSAAKGCEQAGLITEGEQRNVDPERFGVLYGCDLIGTDLDELKDAFKAGIEGENYDFSTWGEAAMGKIMPLWMLKYLPNMPACHIGIALDARGPNNTSTMERGSCLEAMTEAVKVLERGDADVMISGSCGNKINPTVLARSRSYNSDPWDKRSLDSPRPFDADRELSVLSEGAGSFVLETEEFALARGAKPLAKIRACARTMAPDKEKIAQKDSIARALALLLKESGLKPEEIGHVNADGVGTVHDDAVEAAAIREVLGDVPVFSSKGYLGNAGSGTGAVELAISLMILDKGIIPPVKNCSRIAEDCPINVVVGSPREIQKKTFIKINHTNAGRAFAMLLEKY
ncbi:MAG: beta-ketoacyl-[acyl-carrier-protein] synthase family protein [Planctomycetia bacterium]|nr:beta-ketoacyl-[acyl-carrier-protein] synthase family protein [Planctomycetia bacterium]